MRDVIEIEFAGAWRLRSGDFFGAARGAGGSDQGVGHGAQ